MDYQGQFSNMPLGLNMAVLMNEDARKGFDSLSETEKEHVIMKCKDAKTKEEMDRIIDSFTPGENVKEIFREPEV